MEKVAVSKFAVLNLVLVENLGNANSLAYALQKDILIIVNFEVRISQGRGCRFDNDQYGNTGCGIFKQGVQN